MYVQVDSEAYVHNMMEAILNYKKDISAVDKADMYITTKSSQSRTQKTTFGWKLLVQRKNGIEHWTPFKYLK